MGCHQKYLEKCANLKTETVIISTYPQYSFNGNGSIVQKSLKKQQWFSCTKPLKTSNGIWQKSLKTSNSSIVQKPLKTSNGSVAQKPLKTSNGSIVQKPLKTSNEIWQKPLKTSNGIWQKPLKTSNWSIVLNHLKLFHIPLCWETDDRYGSDKHTDRQIQRWDLASMQQKQMKRKSSKRGIKREET